MKTCWKTTIFLSTKFNVRGILVCMVDWLIFVPPFQHIWKCQMLRYLVVSIQQSIPPPKFNLVFWLFIWFKTLCMSFPQQWEVGKTKQLSFRLPPLMVLLGNSLQRASVSSTEGSTHRTQSHSRSGSPLRDPVSFPHFGLSSSVSSRSLRWASGGFLVV